MFCKAMPAIGQARKMNSYEGGNWVRKQAYFEEDDDQSIFVENG